MKSLEKKMEFRRPPPQEIRLKITPLIDMVFLLLVFFLLTSSFVLQEGIKVDLPSAKSSEIQQEKEEIVISITKDNEIYLNQRQVDLETLSQGLVEIIKEDPNKPVVIRADKGIILEMAVKVLDIVRLSGAKRVVISTKIEKGV